ncbi:hypothetical protein OM419_06795 [Enterobacter roggenkampii]|uniref:hypothetical protein n=1 Tax=Enterobacter roggenkampii TaxID=1812935 RepID=UPI00240D282F|nr:hypothetical protein [Enterobacter roggenkampii]WFC88150.1 hypothetical protein OM419_06795 [Enterobacter roggenkampii]
MTLIHNDLPSLGMNSNGPEKYGKGASWSIYGQGKNNLSASSNTGFFDGQSFSLSKLTAKLVVDCQAANYYLCHILAQHDAAYFRFAKGQMNNEALTFFTVDNALYYVCIADFLRSARLRHF